MSQQVTRCQHKETGHVAELPTDALAFYLARGWEPVTGSRSRSEAEAEAQAAEAAAAEKAAREARAVPPRSIRPRTATTEARQPTDTAGDAGPSKEQ